MRIWAAFGRDNTRGVKPDGPASLDRLGHRQYVGGRWDEIGRLQFDFLVGQGLRPEHTLLDIACGSLRGGRFFIEYLEPGHYLGIDKEHQLIEAGVREELTPAIVAERRPEFVVSDSFDFAFSRVPDMALAQSLFTHLPPAAIRLCLRRLRAFAPACTLYATFLETPKRLANPARSNDHHGFRYTQRQMRGFATRTGWRFDYVGDWGHPRDQVMVVYRPR